MSKVKIALIGAGSVAFTRLLLMDILAVPELQDAEIRLMDISDTNLQTAVSLSEHVIGKHALPVTLVATTDRREALRDADFVIVTIRVGGWEAYRHDIEIPLKYGVGQCVGDTLGPGGVFYALRTIPVLLDIAADMRELCPNALMMNYTNPMAMNTWALQRAGGIRAIGLCHGVQHTSHLLARALGVPAKELDYIAAGINHQTWFVKVEHKSVDMTGRLLEAFESKPELMKIEPVRVDVLRRFGYFSTESNGHLSEYLPWYRKNAEELEQKWVYDGKFSGGATAGYLNFLPERQVAYEETLAKWLNGTEPFITLGQRSVEHASYIIEALVTGRTYRAHLNVPNDGLIPNLPQGSIVELPCYVDRTGIHPVHVGPLPLACAATCRASISVQEMAVEAALTGNRELVKQAVLHDPLTAAVCGTEEVWAMCDEMFEALEPWMPQFGEERRTWQDLPGPKQ